MSENSKRTYTVPVLLVIIFVLSILIVVSYSKYLWSQQTHTTDQGQRLSERYSYALMFTDNLRNSTELLLNAKSEAERLSAMKLLGMAMIASGETTGLFVEASHLTSGQSRQEAAKPLIEAMTVVVGEESALARLAGQEGSLTAEELAELTVLRDGFTRMYEQLNRFRAPSGEAGFRQMMTLQEWKAPALDAATSLEQIAAELRE